jgi:cytochrome c biogenesis protein CcdA
VALFEFPCTGGIYVAILGMLAVKASQLEGIIYLLLYNIAFVIPLIAILVLASNRQVVEKLRDWQKVENLKMKLLMGLFMIALGAIILIFLI